ncbi:MAG: MotA/TolQ/ExbB proton channel family protein [Roseburia sp.]|nr:MotA/TolQ/ExbB proton channel family protein [Roseburia sp.]
MKNRLYYILFFVYVIVAAVVLYVNGVFTGNPTDMVNLLINGGFLVIIGVLFLISTISFGRLNCCTEELKCATEQMYKEFKEAGGKSLWSDYQEKKNLFEAESLKSAYGKYRVRMRSLRAKRGYTAVCDLEEYINEDLLDRVGMSFFNSGMAGILTGLGILGTFLGLSIGLGSFDGNDIYAVSDNVGTLLGGMKVAFHTSVYGILFSLIFSVVYRSIMADAYEKLENFLVAYRQCVVPPAASEDENQAAMLMYQANISSSLKQMLELMKGENRAQLEGLSRIVDSFVAQLEMKMGSSFTQLGNTLNSSAAAQQSFALHCEELEKAAAALLESQKQTLAGQEELAGRLTAQGKLIYDTCQEMSQDISNQLYTFEQMRDLYEK